MAAHVSTGPAAFPMVPPSQYEKYDFSAKTGNQVIILGPDIRLVEGVNSWSADSIKKFLTPEIEQRFQIQFRDPDPRLENESKSKKKTTAKKKETNTAKTEKTETKEPSTDSEYETYNGPGGAVQKSLDKAKEKEELVQFTAVRFATLDKDRAEKKVKAISDISKLKKVRVELEALSGAKMHRSLVDDRLVELGAEPGVN